MALQENRSRESLNKIIFTHSSKLTSETVNIIHLRKIQVALKSRLIWKWAKTVFLKVKVDFKVDLNSGCFQNVSELFFEIKVGFNFAWFEIRTFSYFSRKVTQSHYKYYFSGEFHDGGKWKQHLPVSFSGKQRSLWISRGYWYFLLNKGAEFPVTLSLSSSSIISGIIKGN